MRLANSQHGRQIALCLTSVMVFAISLWGAAAARESVSAREAELRELRLDVQRLERRVQRLGDQASAQTLRALERSRDALRVRLAEALEGARGKPGVLALAHQLVEQEVADHEAATNFRLSLEGLLAHGATLLDVLGVVRSATAPWPTETRGCLLQRVVKGLRVDCTIDMLHWHDLQIPVDG